MKRLGLWAIAILIIVGVQSANSQSSNSQSDTTLAEKPVFGKQAKVISVLLDNNHYRRLHLNDSLSSAILDAYILALDNSKIYFLASDIASFEKYRYKIDDLTKLEDTSPAFVIYRVFRTRFDQRMKYVMNTLVTTDFDFTKDEFYETNRDKAPWPKTTQELDGVWTKIIKNYALSLKLAGKKKEEITET